MHTMTLYDLGTHYGEGLRKVLALHPRGTFNEIYCFEPNPTIPVHVHLSDIEHPKLHILKKAVLDRYDQMPFYAQTGSGQGFGAGLEGFGSDGAHWDAGEVDTVDIVHIIQAYDKPCVVKIDVEGAEWPIMRKLVKSARTMALIDTLYIEWHMKYGDEHERYRLDRILRDNNINVIEWD
jgi:FkbM family methyltransferase